MRKVAILLVVLSLAASVVPAMAGEKTATVSSKSAGETAIYSVPGILEGTVLRDLAKALTGSPGILVAQLEPGAKTFNVTFEPGKTNPQKILQMLQTVVKDARLDKVVAAQGTTGASHDCGKCPHSKSCAGAKPKK